MELTEARRRHAELSEKLLDAQYRYHVLDAPTISDVEYDTGLRELNADRGRVPRAAHARLAHAARRRRDIDSVHRRRAPGAAAQPGQRVLGRGVFRLVRPRRQAGRDRALPVRAEDRRARDRPGVRAGPPGQRRDPRRRADRRGRHAERQDDQVDPRPARRGRRARAARGARRGVPVGGGVRPAERVAAGGGQAGLRQSAQRRRRVAAAEGPPGHRVPRARARSCTASAGWWAPRPTPGDPTARITRRRRDRRVGSRAERGGAPGRGAGHAVRLVRAAARLGPAGQRQVPGLRRPRRGPGVHRLLRRPRAPARDAV